MTDKLGRLLLWAILLIAVALAALAGINLYEEELTPQAKALLAPPADIAGPDKNGYFLYVGLAAPAGQDAARWGQARLLAISRAEEKNATGAPEYAKAVRDPSPKFPCRSMFRAPQDCVSVARERPAELSAWRAQHAERLERYQRLRAFEVVEDTIFLTSAGPAQPAFGTATAAHRATLMQAAALVEQGKAGEAVRELQQEAALHRRMVAGARTLAVKMESTDAAAQDYLLLSLLLEERAAAMAPLLPQIQQMTRPLSAAELDLGKPLREEYASLARYMYSPERWPGRNPLSANPMISELPGKLLYKPKATVNLLATLVPSLLDLAKAPPTQFAARERALSRDLAARTGLCCSPHNPVGRLTADVGTPAPYYERVHDLDGLVRLVALQAQIVGKKVPLAGVPAYLAQSPAELADPYTGKPMQWDESRRQIYFRSSQLERVLWFPERFGQGSGRVGVRIPAS